MKKRPTYLRPLAVAAVLTTAVLGTGAASAATSSGSGVKVTNTESVQVYVDPDGKLGMQHVYEQLTLAGHGSVKLANPIATDGLRNLNGFAGVSVKDGNQIVDTTVDGKKQLRSVSNYKGKLPVTLKIVYKLDGKVVKPGDVVGRSGHLEVTYTVENVTAVPTQLTFNDGKGGKVTKTVDVPIPLVGSLSTTAPSNFDNVVSKEASMGGDGHGGTQMQFTMTLLPPVGPATSTFGYSADITDGVVPRAELQVLPVDPLQSPTFSSAASSYKGGADTGVELTGGALQMDDGLVRLRGGASDLVAGLIKLHDGAGQLSTGLKDTAVPGAHKLADGTTQLDDGGKQLNDGLQQLKSKTPQLAGGVHQIYAGQKKLAAGLAQLYSGVQGLPDKVRSQVQSDAKYKQLTAALDVVLKKDVNGTPLIDRAATDLSILSGIPLDGLTEAQKTAVQNAFSTDPAKAAKTDFFAVATAGSLARKLVDPQDGLLATINEITAGIREQLSAGIGVPTKGCDPEKTLRCGAAALADGGKQLNDAVPQLRSGVNQLAAGSQQLSDGLGLADDGAHKLADGLGAAADGAGKIDDGLGQARDGAPQIVDGAKQLSEKGSQKIAEAGQETAQSYGEMYAELVAEGKRAREDSMAIGAPQGATAMTAYQYIVTGDDGQSSRNLDRVLLAGGLLIASGGGLVLRRRFVR